MQDSEIFAYKRKESPLEGEPAEHSLIDPGTLLSLLCGLLAARASFLGGAAPLGLAWYTAFAAGDKWGYMLIAALLGTLTQGGGTVRVKYAAALGLFAALRRLIKTPLWDRPWAAPAAGAVAMMAASLAEMCYKGFLYYDIAASLAQSLAVFGCGLIFARAVSVVGRGGKVMSDDEAVSLAVLAGAAVAGLQGFTLGGVKLLNIAAMYIVLISALKCGAGVSAASGVALGFISGLASGDIPALAGAFAFVGLTSGLMQMFGRWGVAAGAVLANAAFSLYYSGSSLVIINVTEIAVGAVLFAATPGRLLKWADRLFAMRRGFNPAEAYMLRQRRQAADTLQDLSRALACLSAFMPEGTEKHEKSIYRLGVMFERVAQKVCDDCTLGEYCWTQNFDETYKLFAQIVELIKQDELSAREIGAALTGKCARTDRLVDVTSNMYEIFKAENLCEGRAEEYRALAAAQLKNIADVFEEHRKALEKSIDAIPHKSGELERALYRLGYDVRGMCVTKNRMGLYEVTLELLGGSSKGLAQAVGEILDCDISIKGMDAAGDGCIVTLAQNEKYAVEAFVLCVDKQGNRTVGDSGACFKTKDGKYYCLLSDGMGSGQEAARESRYAVSLFESLTQAGFEPAAALKVINSALILSSKTESCTTMDIVSVNLLTGEIEMIKAGAAGTIFKNDTSSEIVRWPSMPLGILELENVEVRRPQMERPEYLVMMTDGIPDNCGERTEGEEFIRLAVEACQEDGAVGLAKAVMDAALSLGPPKDDMTVLVARLCRRIAYN